MKKGELTRDRIIAVAAPLFNERGFAGCSMADIMEATGLEKGGLYRHFSSKEALATAALEFAIDEVRQARLPAIDGESSAILKLQATVSRFVDGPSSIRGGCPLLNAAVDADDGNKALRSLSKAAFEDWRGRLRHLIREAVRAGEIDRCVDVAALADTFIASLEGALVLSRLDQSQTALKRVQLMLNHLLGTVATPAGQAALSAG